MKGTPDYNTQIKLARIPNQNYPDKQTDIFQLKFGPPVPTDKVKEGQVVVENLYISIDAAMRTWINGLPSYVKPVKPGMVMKALTVGRVIFSKSQNISKGELVVGHLGWEKYSVAKDKNLTKLPPSVKNPENFLVLSISGLTAYFGLNKIGKIKPKEIVVISAAAGGVGQIAIQYAKAKDCIVCGIAGGQQKCNIVKSLGADYVIDYKKQSVSDKLKQYFKQGIDVYLDNVGGQMLDDVLNNLKNASRIVLCGAISNYKYIGKDQNTNNYYRLKNYPKLIIKRAYMQGFIYFDYESEFPQALKELNELVEQGKIKINIQMLYGLDECPNALIRLLQGKNKAKLVVNVSGPRPKL